MAQWIRRLPTEQEIPGSSPGMGFFFVGDLIKLIKMEEQGIDPCAFCMQSRRSTI